MAEQKERKGKGKGKGRKGRGSKEEKPEQATPKKKGSGYRHLRESNPQKVLARVIQSSGFKAAVAYAEKFSIVGALNKMVSDRQWVQQKMNGQSDGGRPVHMRVGRALKRANRRASGRAYLSDSCVRAAVHAEALAMNEARSPKVVAPVVLPPAPKAKRKVLVKRSVKTKAKAKVAKRRK